jgi:hypothetical protein
VLPSNSCTMACFLCFLCFLCAIEPSVERWWKNVHGSWPETEGSYFEVVGFAALEKPDHAIPRQSVFQAAARCFITKAAAASGARRVALTERFFEFLLQPEYAAYHRRYAEWRSTMLAKCDEYCASALCTRRLRLLCRRWQRLYAEPEDQDPVPAECWV